MDDADDNYPCVGICMADPDSGYCLGCGRPPPPVSPVTQGIVVERVPRDPPWSKAPNNDCPDES